MTDDVKAAVERFHEWEFDGLDARDHATLLAHLDGEPARTAAAVAAAREEQARVDMDACNAALAHDSSWTPSLTATPLADRIAELECERDGAKP